MKLYCATTNRGKLAEFQIAAQGRFEVEPLPGLSDLPPAPETGETFEENAVQKALYYGTQCRGYLFADDSGLEVAHLGGAPGVLSARFAGPRATDAANNLLLLERMRGVADRQARFVCVAALTFEGKVVKTFRGDVEGILLEAPQGDSGFGYDPLFHYPPLGRTFAQLDAHTKSKISHRGKALAEMFDYLENQRRYQGSAGGKSPQAERGR